MPQTTPPRFEGQIEIITGINDRLDWDENGTPLFTVLPAGTYWPNALIATLWGQMNVVSSVSGAGRTYTGSIDDETGQLTLSVDTGVWFPKTTAAESNKLLTGGDGTGYVFGNRGPNHLGFELAGSYLAAAQSHTGDIYIANGFHPNQPTDTDTGDRRRITSAQSIDLSGQAFTRVFSNPTAPPTFRNMSFQLIKEGPRTQWFETHLFYASAGKPFLLHKPRNASSVGTYILTGGSLSDPSFEDQQHHQAWWQGRIELLRVS